MKIDHISESEREISAINGGLNSPENSQRNFNPNIFSIDVRQERPLNPQFLQNQGGFLQQTKTPNRTPQPKKPDRRLQTFSPLPDLEMPFFYFNSNSNSNEVHLPQIMNVSRIEQERPSQYYKQAMNQLIIPLERPKQFTPEQTLQHNILARIPHLSNSYARNVSKRNKRIAFFKATTENINFQDKIISPSCERTGEKMHFDLKKMNSFKKGQTILMRKNNADRQTALLDSVQKITNPKSKIKKFQTKTGRAPLKITPIKQLEVFCYCRKSNCKKEYCNCFKAKVPCNPKCGCYECSNNVLYYEGADRNEPISFPPGSRFNEEDKRYSTGQEIENERNCAVVGAFLKRGCNCRKSYCQKKYCDCFSQGRKCSSICHCNSCNNR